MPAPDLPPPPATETAPRDRPIHVHLHMNFVRPETFRGGLAIVIDAVRASTTICAALSNGAAGVVPALTAEDARRKAVELRLEAAGRGERPRIVLGGERAGVRIEGFDLDNSPFSYTRERVEGTMIVFTTSNGTAGLLHAAQADRVLVGTLSNLAAVVDAVADDARPAHVLCCGTRNDVSLDDCLAAGAFVELLLARGRTPTSDDGALLCLHAWQNASRSFDDLDEAMKSSRGGRNMVNIGLGRDVTECSRVDAYPVVPEFDAAAGVIKLA